MIRCLAAFAWLRWRLLVNGITGARRRDPAERLSRVGALGLPLLIGTLSLAAAALLSWLGFTAGLALGEHTAETSQVLLMIRAVLLTASAVLVIMPLAAATQGGATSHSRLLLLPISRASLHLADVLAGTAAPWLAPVIPGLALLAAGLAAAGRGNAALVALAAAAALVVALAGLGALASSLVARLMRKRRRAELFTLLFVLALSVGSILPAVVPGRRESRHTGSSPRTGWLTPARMARIDEALVTWSVWLPTELHGRSIAAALEGRRDAAWSLVGLLGLEAVGIFLLSARAHGALLDSSGREGGRRQAARMARVGPRFPGLSPAASSVALVHARNALRSVRGRLAVLMPGPFLASLGVVSRVAPGQFPGGEALGSSGPLLLGTGLFFGLYTLEAFTMNQFACDRGGLALEWLLPISDDEMLKGKAVGGALVFAPLAALCVACGLLAVAGGSPLDWISVVLGSAATYALMTPFAAWISALLPVAADLSKTGSGGNPHGLAMLFGTLLTAAVSLPPTLSLVVVSRFLGRPGLALALVVSWCAIAAALSFPLLAYASRTLGPRRENIAIVAEGR